MEFYFQLQMIPQQELPAEILMADAFLLIHKAVAKLEENSIGVSFPRFDRTLGDLIRLHGSKASLEGLYHELIRCKIDDYTKLSQLLAVPSRCEHRCVKRVQVKSSSERLRRRSLKKGWLTEENALVAIPEEREKRTHLPFLKMRSCSSRHPFRLFIEHGPILYEPLLGPFSSYGLSSKSTVPWF